MYQVLAGGKALRVPRSQSTTVAASFLWAALLLCLPGGEQLTSPCNRSFADLPLQSKRPAPWTSGLMKDGAPFTDISQADAERARGKALELFGAVTP